jgi:hypothetical protein
MTTPHGAAGIPRPGGHLPGRQAHDAVDPDQVRAEVEELLAQLSGGGSVAARGRVLDAAHDVLVRALGALDKI